MSNISQTESYDQDDLTPVHLSLFRNKSDTDARAVTWTWGTLLQHLASPEIRADKDGLLFSPARFDPPRRAKANARELSLLVLDYDSGLPIADGLRPWLSLGLRCAHHTTHSHLRSTADHPEPKPRYRVIIPLSEPIPASLFSALWRWAAERSGGAFDPVCKDASRVYYAPAKASADAPYDWGAFDGKPLDWRALDLREVEPIRSSSEPKPTDQRASRYAQAALTGEVVKVRSAATGQRNNVLNKAAFALGQLVGAGALSLGEVEFSLLGAAVGLGLSESEARRTIRSGIAAGEKEPRSLSEKPERPRAAVAKAPKIEKPESEPPAAIRATAQAKFSESLFEGTLTLEISPVGKRKVVAVARNCTDILHRNEISLDKAPDRETFIAALRLTDEQRPLINQAMLRLADQIEKAHEHCEGREHLPGGFTIAQQLIGIADEFAEIFHDAGGNGYASVEVDGHRETYKLGSRDFKEWLGGMFYETSSEVAASEKITEAIAVLRHKAKRTEEREVNVRIAEHAGAIYLDLCDRDWRQVEITEDGRRVIDSKDSPVRFRRAGGMLALPEPVQGGSLAELRELLNLPAEDSDNWPLILGWLVATFKPCNPAGFDYPVLTIHGEQGSAKSTACRLLRRLIDPNKADLRATPKDERDLAIAAEHGRVLGFDNLTYLSDSLSNALCRMATGGGFATRELYTDEGEVIFDSQRPVILNGIAEVVSKSDLLDRSILIYLPQIEGKARKLRRVIDRKFVAAQPRILGALLTAVSKGLQKLKQGVTLNELPRMADFAEWVTACEPGLGLSEGQFIRAYIKNEATANSLAIEASPVAQAVISFLADCKSWEGSTGGLLKALNERLETNREDPKKKNGWPKSARGLGARLKEIAPNLRRNGVEIAFGERGKRGYTVTLSQSAATDPPEQGPEQGKDVHHVHHVHQANGFNGLGGEHVGEHLENDPHHNVHPINAVELGEHLEDELSGNVHPHVHPVNDCKQKAGEHGEHGEHLSGTPAPDWWESTDPRGRDGLPLPF